MSSRTLIVARLDPAHTGAVAELFGASDRTELPALVGVRSRTLFSYHSLYFHLVESDGPTGVARRLGEVREHPLFRELNSALADYVRPYDPSWRQPADAMATTFYQWSREDTGPRSDS
ncbi:MAG: TcmI family type II polyketide cyclase [Micromonosporaceae bacterium]|nr:TcmI family type II polyketide cyclase [Micromonosporaceae bacterium]